MARGGKLEVRITGDTSGLGRAFGDAESKAGSFHSKMSSIGGRLAKTFGTLAKGVALGVAGGIAGLAAMAPALINLGGQLDTWSRKVNTVFESSSVQIRAWADQNNELFGVTKEELAGMAAGFGDLIKPMGFTSQQAADMSQKVVGLAGALSEWTGGSRSAAEVSQILAKAMLGERDGLVELGIKISDADVQARLAAKGQEKLTGAALEQAKALATQELIFEKSTDAQKAYAEGGNATLRASNKLKAVWGDIQVVLATRLVPVLAMVVGKLVDVAKVAQPVIAEVSGGIRAMVMAFQAPEEGVTSGGFAGMLERVGIVARKLFDGYLIPIFNEVKGGVRAFFAAFRDGSDEVTSSGFAGWLESLGVHFRNVFDVIKRNWSKIRDAITTGFTALQTALEAAYKAFQPIVRAVADFIRANPKPVFAALAVVIGTALVGALWSMAAAVAAAFSPVYLVIGAVALLAGGLVLAYQKVDWFRSAVDAVASFITDTLVPAIKSLWHWFQDNLLPIIQKVAEFYVNAYSKAFQMAVDAAQWLIDKLSVLYDWFSVNILPTLMVVADWVGNKLVENFGKARDGMQWIVEKAMMIYDWFNTYVLPILKVVGEWMGTTFRDNLALARDGMRWVIDKAKSLWNWLDKIIGTATDAASAIASVGGGVLDALNPFGGGKASGGPVMPNRTYLVGERGPELFTPPAPGVIIPNHALGGGGSTTINNTFQITVPAGTPPEMVDYLISEVNRRTRANGGRSVLV